MTASSSAPGDSWYNPIWYRNWRIFAASAGPFPYTFIHDDYDGAADAHDDRHGEAYSVEEAKALIDHMEHETEGDTTEDIEGHE